jgi:hypothetical protein
MGVQVIVRIHALASAYGDCAQGASGYGRMPVKANHFPARADGGVVHPCGGQCHDPGRIEASGVLTGPDKRGVRSPFALPPGGIRPPTP